MNESVVIFVVLATLAAGYLWIYPRYAGNDVKKMAWLDAGLGIIPLGFSALMFWESDPPFTFIFFETNWFLFTLLALVALEMPLFFWYVKARGLGREYWALLGLGATGTANGPWATASVESVAKQLNDTKWDGLRTPGAKKFLLIASNLLVLGGTTLLFVAGNPDWGPLSLIFILLGYAFWFLLRQSVRLIADAPHEALDERLLRIRDQSYVIAYRWLASMCIVLAAALLAFTVYADFQASSNLFVYEVPLTWTQIQAIFWLVFAYTAMLPSMAVITQEISAKGKK